MESAKERKNETSQSQGGSESRDTETVHLNATDTNGKRIQRSAESRFSGERLWSKSFRYIQTTPDTISQRTQIQYEQRGSSIGTCLAAMARKDRLSAPTGKPMSLNPAFVEEMMGYPIGHTDLKH